MAALPPPAASTCSVKTMLKPRYIRTVVLKVLSHNPMSAKDLRTFIDNALIDQRGLANIESPLRDVSYVIQDMSDPAKLAGI